MACGVLAGIATAVLMLVVVRAQQRRGDERPTTPAQCPPVIVVGGVPQPFDGPLDKFGRDLRTQQGPQAVDGAWRAPETPRREFRVIGEE